MQTHKCLKKNSNVFLSKLKKCVFFEGNKRIFYQTRCSSKFFWNQKFYLLCKERLRNVNDCRCDVFPNSDLHRGVPSSGAFPNMSNFLKYFILSCNVNSPLYILQNWFRGWSTQSRFQRWKIILFSLLGKKISKN